MRHFLLSLCLLLTSFSALAQEFDGNYTTISYTQLFDSIAAETDTVFRLSDHIIKYDPATDSLFGYKSEIETKEEISYSNRLKTLEVNTSIEFDNVQFHNDFQSDDEFYYSLGVLSNIRFNQPVRLKSVFEIELQSCEFKADFTFSSSLRTPKGSSFLKDQPSLFSFLTLRENKFHGNTEIRYQGLIDNEKREIPILNFIRNNVFLSDTTKLGVPSKVNIYFQSIHNSIMKNVVAKNTIFSLMIRETPQSSINNNNFNQALVLFTILDLPEDAQLYFAENSFDGPIMLNIDKINNNDNIDFDQFNGQLINRSGISHYMFREREIFGGLNLSEIPDTARLDYLARGRAKYLSSVESEIALRGMFYDHLKRKYNTKKASAVYVDMKDIETQRLKFEYEADPNFDTFFTLQINRFLKVFSAYGTRPAKAVVFSAYVILLFALVYLFFPNYWDSHGKHRIMDRYRFFLKYVNKDSGIHEVYLDEKKPELLAAEDFKLYLEEQGKTAPKFFMSTALPLYRWSVSGTKSFSWLLSKVDVLKGKWSDTKPSKQGGKSALLIGAFIVALLYDIFIKMLNALMLSINTFTTLGFGEIPIKGLPRYLAIIQGFIGWFMLTIFSVSLISQLLN